MGWFCSAITASMTSFTVLHIVTLCFYITISNYNHQHLPTVDLTWSRFRSVLHLLLSSLYVIPLFIKYMAHWPEISESVRQISNHLSFLHISYSYNINQNCSNWLTSSSTFGLLHLDIGKFSLIISRSTATSFTINNKSSTLLFSLLDFKRHISHSFLEILKQYFISLLLARFSLSDSLKLTLLYSVKSWYVINSLSLILQTFNIFQFLIKMLNRKCERIAVKGMKFKMFRYWFKNIILVLSIQKCLT